MQCLHIKADLKSCSMTIAHAWKTQTVAFQDVKTHINALMINV